jgi:hypothetical protein
MRGNHPRQMRGSARSCHNHANTATGSLFRVIGGAIGRAVRGSDVDLIRNPKFVESLGCLAHDLQIGVAAHYDGNNWVRWHCFLHILDS